MVSFSSYYVTVMILSTTTTAACAFTLYSNQVKSLKHEGFARKRSSLHADSSDEVKSRLSDEDRDQIAKARLALGKSVEKNEEEEPPKLFEDQVYDDMQNILLLLEKRVKEGPSALNLDEFQQFKNYASSITQSVLGGPSSDVASSGPAQNMKAAAVAPPLPQVQQNVVTDTSQDEGPAYEGKGGLGLASGTRNTYTIEGMDEMSPEEYREALQKSVSEAQAKRKQERNHVVGNRASHQYLDQLGWGGHSSSWKPRDVSWKSNDNAD